MIGFFCGFFLMTNNIWFILNYAVAANITSHDIMNFDSDWKMFKAVLELFRGVNFLD